MNRITSEQLTQIGPSKKKDTFSELTVGFVADKFFITAILASLVGIGWLGTHLWLGLQGELTLKSNFAELRQLHILIQFYLFFALFILGFIAQAAPKLCGVSQLASGKTIYWIITMISGVILWQIMPEQIYGKALVSLTFILVLKYLLSFVRKAENPPINVGVWLVFGLLSFAVSPFIEIQSPGGALIVFWFSIVPIIIGVSRQFIVGFLNGSQPLKTLSNSLILLYLLSSIIAGLTYIIPVEAWFFQTWGAIALIIFSLHLLATKYWRAVYTAFKNPLSLSFISGFFWAFLGAINLAVYGNLYLDMTLHIWAIGWGTSLIIGVSLQILSFMSDKKGTFAIASLLLIALWQVVAFGRGLNHLVQIPHSFSWIVLIAATVVIFGWLSLIVYFERIISRKTKLIRNTIK